jgi:hypothetical protein
MDAGGRATQGAVAEVEQRRSSCRGRIASGTAIERCREHRDFLKLIMASSPGLRVTRNSQILEKYEAFLALRQFFSAYSAPLCAARFLQSPLTQSNQ